MSDNNEGKNEILLDKIAFRPGDENKVPPVDISTDAGRDARFEAALAPGHPAAAPRVRVQYPMSVPVHIPNRFLSRRLVISGLPNGFRLGQLLEQVPRQLGRLVVGVDLVNTQSLIGSHTAVIETIDGATTKHLYEVLKYGRLPACDEGRRDHEADDEEAHDDEGDDDESSDDETGDDEDNDDESSDDDERNETNDDEAEQKEEAGQVTLGRPIRFTDGDDIAYVIDPEVVPSVSASPTRELRHAIAAGVSRTVEARGIDKHAVPFAEHVAMHHLALATKYDPDAATFSAEFKSVAVAVAVIARYEDSRRQAGPDFCAAVAFAAPLLGFDGGRPASAPPSERPVEISLPDAKEAEVWQILASQTVHNALRLAKSINESVASSPTALCEYTADAPARRYIMYPIPAPVPIPMNPITWMTDEDYLEEARREHAFRDNPVELYDCDSEVKNGVLARIRSTRVPWGVMYDRVNFDRLMELQHIDDEDPMWNEILDRTYAENGEINLRRLRLGREPRPANLWGILLS